MKTFARVQALRSRETTWVFRKIEIGINDIDKRIDGKIVLQLTLLHYVVVDAE